MQDMDEEMQKQKEVIEDVLRGFKPRFMTFHKTPSKYKEKLAIFWDLVFSSMFQSKEIMFVEDDEYTGPSRRKDGIRSSAFIDEILDFIDQRWRAMFLENIKALPFYDRMRGWDIILDPSSLVNFDISVLEEQLVIKLKERYDDDHAFMKNYIFNSIDTLVAKIEKNCRKTVVRHFLFDVAGNLFWYKEKHEEMMKENFNGVFEWRSEQHGFSRSLNMHFIGFLRDGVPHGFGTLYMKKSQKIYSGNFVNGVFSDGCCYDSDWKLLYQGEFNAERIPHGEGDLHLYMKKSQKIYRGKFVDGVLSFGHCYDSAWNLLYCGQLCGRCDDINGKTSISFHGEGSLYHEDGKTLKKIGEFVMNDFVCGIRYLYEKKGRGKDATYTYLCKEKGYFSKNKMVKGSEFDSNDVLRFTGEFEGEAGDFSYGVEYLEDGVTVHFEGRFFNNAPHGKGEVRREDGTVSNGFFKEGHMYGAGFVRLADGSVYRGSFTTLGGDHTTPRPHGYCSLHDPHGACIYPSSTRWERGELVDMEEAD